MYLQHAGTMRRDTGALLARRGAHLHQHGHDSRFVLLAIRIRGANFILNSWPKRARGQLLDTSARARGQLFGAMLAQHVSGPTFAARQACL